MEKILALLLLCLLLVPAALAEDSRIGIISAMPVEVELLLKNAQIDHVDTVGGVDYNVGTLCGRPVVIAQAGIGKILSAVGATAMLNNYDISQVLFTGIAGGVGDETRVLDVVIATQLVQHDYGQITNAGFVWFESFTGDKGYYACDERLADAAFRAAENVVGPGHVYRGIVVSGDQFVASEEYVKKLQEDFNAVACEMEGASIALVCTLYDVPFVVIRTMSDKADGAAQETFENLQNSAADNSCRIVMEMLDNPALWTENLSEESQTANQNKAPR